MQYKTEPSEKEHRQDHDDLRQGSVDEANQKAYLRTRGRYAVNGFRKGKAPKHVIELNYGKGVFYEDALTDLFNDTIPRRSKRRRTTSPSSGRRTSPSRTSARTAPCSSRSHPSNPRSSWAHTRV